MWQTFELFNDQQFKSGKYFFILQAYMHGSFRCFFFFLQMSRLLAKTIESKVNCVFILFIFYQLLMPNTSCVHGWLVTWLHFDRLCTCIHTIPLWLPHAPQTLTALCWDSHLKTLLLGSAEFCWVLMGSGDADLWLKVYLLKQHFSFWPFFERKTVVCFG